MPRALLLSAYRRICVLNEQIKTISEQSVDAEELFNPDESEKIVRYPDLKGKRVFITGGGSGIGAYFVTAFALQGAQVGFLSLNPDPAKALCDHLASYTQVTPFYRSCDIRNISALKCVLDEYAAEVGPIEVLVNNAARDDRACLLDLTEAQWNDSIDTNLKPYVFSAQHVVPNMEAQGAGAIINISSNAPELGVAGFPAYIAAKAAISGMTMSLAHEVGYKGVRVNSILPGWCLTERQKRLWMSDEAVKHTLSRQALKRMLNGIDLANAALFLASSASSMITGVNLNVDGGIS